MASSRTTQGRIGRGVVIALAGTEAMKLNLLRIVGLTVCAALAGACAGPRALLDPADEAYFRDQAGKIVDSAALAPGQTSGGWTNGTPYRMHVPGGNMGYTAFWVRDAVMMLGGDFIAAGEIEDWIRLIAATVVGPEDWHVRPGVVVPAWAIPDHVNFDGQATFYPGNYETGGKQGGAPFGKYPPLDDHFYFVGAVYEHWRSTGSLALFRSAVKTAFGEMKLSDLCERAYRVAPVDAATGLVAAGDVDAENAKDWGFCDGEFKSGRLLFPSALKFVAAEELTAMFEAAGNAAKAAAYRGDARKIRGSIGPAFFHASGSEGEGWLHSATGVGDQPDVWGSAFAVWSGAVEGPIGRKVARGLVRAYREKTAVVDGCVRSILLTDRRNGGGWERSLCAVGEYQNGGYWGTPAGWYIAAMATVDRRAAADMARDFVAFLRGHMRPDGMTEAWEWFSADGKRTVNPLYVATIALPYLSLKRASLVGVGPTEHLDNKLNK